MNKRPLSRPVRAVVAAALLFLLPLAAAPGCSKKGPAKEAAQTPAAKPAPSNWYRFPLDEDAITLDPAYVTDTVSDAVVRQIFDGLVEYNAKNEYVPALAREWSTSADGLAWTFRLNDGVRFHSGRPMTADDVIYSWKRLLSSEGGPRKTLLHAIKGAEAFTEGKSEDVAGLWQIDDMTLEVRLERPTPFFLGLLAMSNTFVVDRQAAEKWGKDFARHPVGTGPFAFKEWKNGSSITLERNPNHFKGAPFLEGVMYRIIPSARNRLEEYKRGNLEHTDVQPEFMEQVKNDPELGPQIAATSLIDFYNIAFNTQMAPFKDNPTLRRAINHAVDKQNILQNVLFGLFQSTDSFVPRSMPSHAGIPPHEYEYNPELAKNLLAQAGYPGGEGLQELRLFVTNSELHRAIAVQIQNDLKRVGVAVQIRALDWSALIAAADNGEGELLQHTWLADYPDPDNFFYTLLNSDNWGPKGNISRYANSRFDELTQQARGISDPAERLRLYSEAAQIAYDDAPWLFLFNNACVILKQPYVEGLNVSGLDRPPRLPAVPLEAVSFRR